MKQHKKLNSSWLANLISQSSGFVLFLIATPFLVKSMGIEKYGALTILFLLPQIAIQLDFGVTATGTRVMALFQAESKFNYRVQVFWEVMATLVVIGLLQVFLFSFFAQNLMQLLQLEQILATQFNDVVIATSCWIFASLIGAGVSIAARAFERFKLLASIQALTVSLFWLGAWGLAIINPDIVLILWCGVFSSVVATILLIFNVRKTIKLPTDILGSRALLLPSYFHFSAGTFAAQASSLLTYHADKFLVAALISPAAVGVYNACASIASKVLVIVSAIATFSFPRAVRLNSEGALDELSDVYLRATRLCVMTSMVIVIPLASLAEPFLQLWLKADYKAEYAYVLILMAAGYLFASFSVVASNVCIGMGGARMPALFAIIGGSTTLILCILLAPEFGLYGAVIASVSGMSQALIFNWLVAKKLGSIQEKQMINFSLSVILFSGVTIFLLSQVMYIVTSWFVLILSGIGIILLLIPLWFLCGLTTENERESLSSLWRKINGNN